MKPHFIAPPPPLFNAVVHRCTNVRLRNGQPSVENDPKDSMEVFFPHLCHHHLADLFPVQEQHQDAQPFLLNVADALGSIAVIVAGTLITLFDW